MYRTGERGDPQGVPQATRQLGVITCLRRTCTLRSIRKESINKSTLQGYPYQTIWYSRQFLRRALKAPYTSRVTIIICCPRAHTASILQVNAAVRLAADYFRRAPLYQGLRILWVIAVYAILLATILLSPFLIQERRAIGLQNLGNLQSLFPTFSIIATSTSFYYIGKQLSLRYYQKIY